MTIEKVYHDTLKRGLDPATTRNALCHFLGMPSMNDLFLRWSEEVADWSKFEVLVQRLESGEPLQYVTNSSYFDGNEFYVDQSVLIPRPETEELLLLVCDRIKKNGYDSFADLGTGSGCLAISLKKRFPDMEAYGSDISLAALEVANRNASFHKVEIAFFHGDWTAPFVDRGLSVDVIVSNPPYISSPATVDKNVLEYEPHTALFAPGGTASHLEILHHAPTMMRHHGLIALEIGEDQMPALATIVQTLYVGDKIEFIRDLQGKYRFLLIELSK